MTLPEDSHDSTEPTSDTTGHNHNVMSDGQWQRPAWHAYPRVVITRPEAWVAAISWLTNEPGEYGFRFWFFIAALVYTVLSVINLLYARYRCTPETVEVRKWFITRETKTIRRQSISSVKLEQGFFAGILRIADVKVEAGHGGDSELTIVGLSTQQAWALNAELNGSWSSAEVQENASGEQSSTQVEDLGDASQKVSLRKGEELVSAYVKGRSSEAGTVLTAFSPSWLVVPVFTGWGVFSVLVSAVVLCGFFDLVYKFFTDTTFFERRMDEFEASRNSQLWLGWSDLWIIIPAVVLCLIAGLCWQIVSYWWENRTFRIRESSEAHLSIYQGRISHSQDSINTRLVRTLRVSFSLRGRWLGIAEVYAKGRGFSDTRLTPYVPREVVGTVVNRVLNEPELLSEPVSKVGLRTLIFRLVRTAVHFPHRAALCGGVWWLAGHFIDRLPEVQWLMVFAIVGALSLWFMAASALAYRTEGFAVTPGYLIHDDGGIMRVRTFIARSSFVDWSWREGPLERLFGMGDLEVRLGGMETTVHSVHRRDAERLLAELVPNTVRRPPAVSQMDTAVPMLLPAVVHDREAENAQRYSPSARRLLAIDDVVWTTIFLVVAIAIFWWWTWPPVWVRVGVPLWIAINAVKDLLIVDPIIRRRHRWHVSDDLVCETSGWLSSHASFMPVKVVDAVKVNQGIRQRRHGLASLEASTRSGTSFRLGMMPHDEAEELAQRLSPRNESK